MNQAASTIASPIAIHPTASGQAANVFPIQPSVKNGQIRLIIRYSA